jgi:hypothetical protein
MNSIALSTLAKALGSEIKAQAALDALRSVDWACVPRIPTQAMLEAAYWAAHEENAAGVWAEMIESSEGG